MATFIRHLIVGRRPGVTLVRALLLGVAAYLFFSHVVRPVRVQGHSMEPTVQDAAFRFAHLRAYRTQSPQRGDIVVIARTGGRVMYLKRVLALPGETVAFDRGVLLLQGEPREEPYLLHAGDWTMEPVRMGEDEYFVAGDNRAAPLDRHVAGTVSIEGIKGRLLP